MEKTMREKINDCVLRAIKDGIVTFKGTNAYFKNGLIMGGLLNPEQLGTALFNHQRDFNGAEYLLSVYDKSK